MKSFLKKVGDKLLVWGVSIKEVWKVFNKRYYHKTIASFVGFVFLGAILLTTIIAISENCNAKISAEKEIMALTALQHKVESEEANQAAESFIMILSGDKTSTVSFRNLKKLYDIDDGYYLRVYTKSETNTQKILSGEITAKQVVVKTDVWGNARPVYLFFIKAGVTSYLALVIGFMIFIKVYVMKKEEQDEKGEEDNGQN